MASTDECFKHSFSSIRARITELEPIENLELLYISNLIFLIFNIEDRAPALVSEVSQASAVSLASVVPHAKEVPHASVVPHAKEVPHASIALAVPHANDNSNTKANAFALAVFLATFFDKDMYRPI